MKNMTHPDILEADRNGLPEGKDTPKILFIGLCGGTVLHPQKPAQLLF